MKRTEQYYSIFVVIVIFTCAYLKFPLPFATAAGSTVDIPKVWAGYKNIRYGFEIYYPSEWFESGAVSREADGHIFLSKDGKARLAAFGMLDPKWYGAELFDKKKIVAEGRAYDQLAGGIYEGDLRSEGAAYGELSEKKVGDYWITLKGKRGERHFFERYVFSCKDKVINVMSLIYHESSRDKYELIIKKLVQRFHAGSGSDTPRCTDG